MAVQAAVMVVVNIHISTGQPVADELFHTRATQLMDELMALSECNPEVVDPVVSSDAQKSVLTVEIIISTDDQIEAVNKALTLLRTGLHAAGAKSAGWPRIERLENRTELMPDLLSSRALPPRARGRGNGQVVRGGGAVASVGLPIAVTIGIGGTAGPLRAPGEYGVGAAEGHPPRPAPARPGRGRRTGRRTPRGPGRSSGARSLRT